MSLTFLKVDLIEKRTTRDLFAYFTFGQKERSYIDIIL